MFEIINESQHLFPVCDKIRHNHHKRGNLTQWHFHPPKKTKHSSSLVLDCFVFTKTFLFINSGRIICHVHKTLGNLIPIKSLVCHNDRFFKVYIIKIDKGFNRHQNI